MPKLSQLVACALALLNVSGCVSTKTSALEDSARLRARSVALTSRPRAAFMATTAGKASFALIGALAMERAGNALVTREGIADPAVEVGQALLAAAEKTYGVVPAPGDPVKIDTTDIAQLARAAKGADFLLDVQSYGQSFSYFPTDWSHYWVMTMLNVRLIDVPGARLVAEGHCAPSTHDDANPPDYDTLVGNHATRLKATLDAQRDRCIAMFKQQVLKIAD